LPSRRGWEDNDRYRESLGKTGIIDEVAAVVVRAAAAEHGCRRCKEDDNSERRLACGGVKNGLLPLSSSLSSSPIAGDIAGCSRAFCVLEGAVQGAERGTVGDALVLSRICHRGGWDVGVREGVKWTVCCDSDLGCCAISRECDAHGTGGICGLGESAELGGRTWLFLWVKYSYCSSLFPPIPHPHPHPPYISQAAIPAQHQVSPHDAADQD
jgi:hypothetical protein